MRSSLLRIDFTMARVLLLLFIGIFSVRAEYLTKKLCKGEDVTKCSVHNVLMEPCAEGGNYCSIKRSKVYTLTADLTPKFTANKLKLAIYGDSDNSGNFSRIVKAPEEICSLLSCPVESEIRQIFDVDFFLDKTFAVAKFPIKVRMWDENEESNACCFTFNVKIKK